MNIHDLLKSSNVEVWEHGEHAHVTEGWIGADCPFCSPRSRHVRLGFSLTSWGTTCWVCGKQDRAGAISAITGMDIGECRRLVGSVESLASKKSRPGRGKLVMPYGTGPMGPAHRKYLFSRGLDPDEMETIWRLQGTGQMSDLPWRIVIPILSDGEVISWTTRELHDRGRRYHNARPDQEVYPAKSAIYGEQHCTNVVCVHEGPGDVWRTGPGAVATMGLKWSMRQVERIAKYPRRLIAFDRSPDAQRRARQLASILCGFDGETIIVEGESDDPGAASDREVRELRAMLR